jgi:hypothetical protein
MTSAILFAGSFRYDDARIATEKLSRVCPMERAPARKRAARHPISSDETRAQMRPSKWMNADQLMTREHILEGVACFPLAVTMTFAGKNLGKLLIRI